MKQTWYWAFKMICLRAHLIFIFACSEAWSINFLRQIKVFFMLTFLVNFFIIFIYKIVISIEVFVTELCSYIKMIFRIKSMLLNLLYKYEYSCTTIENKCFSCNSVRKWVKRVVQSLLMSKSVSLNMCTKVELTNLFCL